MSRFSCEAAASAFAVVGVGGKALFGIGDLLKAIGAVVLKGSGSFCVNDGGKQAVGSMGKLLTAAILKSLLGEISFAVILQLEGVAAGLGNFEEVPRESVLILHCGAIGLYDLR